MGAALSLVQTGASFFFSLFSTSRKNKNPVKLLLVIQGLFALIPFQEHAPSGAQLLYVVKKVQENMEKGIPVPACTAHTTPEIPPGLFSHFWFKPTFSCFWQHQHLAQNQSWLFACLFPSSNS